MEDELEEYEFTTDELPAQDAGDGMPIGNQLTPRIEAHQVAWPDDPAEGPEFDDNAAATIVWLDFQAANNYIDQEQWLLEWNYIDQLYPSPSFDREWRDDGNGRPARISRFNIAENVSTLTTQVRRGIFADSTFFSLEAMGKLASMENKQDYLDAWTSLLTQLCKRADLEYQMELFIDCVCLQGTAIAVPGWEERERVVTTRKSQTPPTQVQLPSGTSVTIHTMESDDFQVTHDKVKESWPFFEFRRLGTTLYDAGWRTPGRPDISAKCRLDLDWVTLEDLLQMKKNVQCYKNIPDAEEMIYFFLENQYGDAESVSGPTRDMTDNTSFVPHAVGEWKRTSKNPFEGSFMRVARWSHTHIMEIIFYKGRKLTIRNQKHKLEDHALGYSSTWWNISNSGYGFGVGRVNSGDQRMAQGILNEILKWIAYPLNAPLMYNTAEGNAPTQSMAMGLGTMWGVNAGVNGDVRKAFNFLQPPELPGPALELYQLATQGGRDAVNANQQTMGGQAGSQQGIGRSAFGAQRLATQADAAISTQILHIEQVLERFLKFLCLMVRERMPIKEIRDILSQKHSDLIIKTLDADFFVQDGLFDLKILAGQKLAQRAAIAQVIPFLLQLVEQPQLLQYMHQKGETINFTDIEKMFIDMSELSGNYNIIVPLTDQEKANVQQFNPEATRMKLEQMMEQLRQQGKLAEIHAKGATDLQNDLVSKAAEQVLQGQQQEPKTRETQLQLAEDQSERNTNREFLENGLPTA